MTPIKIKDNDLIKIAAILFMATGIFMVDWNSELGIALGVLYVFPMIITFWLKREKFIFIIAILFSLLILCGLLKPLPTGVPIYMIALNRILSIATIWSFAVFICIARKNAKIIENQKDVFENTSIELRQQLEVLNAAAIVSIADPSGNIVYVNDMFCKISKYSREELIGNNHRMLKSGLNPDGLFVGMWKAISNRKTWQGEVCNRAKDGSFYWVLTTIAPFINKNEQIEKYVSVRFDITEVKKQQLTLREQADKLKQANEELETFSYSVSHDLRAPLRALEGFSNALMENYREKFDEDGNRWLNYISENASRMGVLINDILGFSRVSRGNVSLKKVNMKVLARDNYENEKNQYPGKKISFTLEELPEVAGDVQMMRQVWQNLISNAMKYSSKKEEIIISIRGWQENGYCVYCVKDNGAGFEEKYAEKIYGVFQRLHSREDFDGTGVGLAIVHRILQKHDGWIKSFGQPGVGAEFTFAIPVK